MDQSAVDVGSSVGVRGQVPEGPDAAHRVAEPGQAASARVHHEVVVARRCAVERVVERDVVGPECPVAAQGDGIAVALIAGCDDQGTVDLRAAVGIGCDRAESRVLREGSQGVAADLAVEDRVAAFGVDFEGVIGARGAVDRAVEGDVAGPVFVDEQVGAQKDGIVEGNGRAVEVQRRGVDCGAFRSAAAGVGRQRGQPDGSADRGVERGDGGAVHFEARGPVDGRVERGVALARRDDQVGAERHRRIESHLGAGLGSAGGRIDTHGRPGGNERAVDEDGPVGRHEVVVQGEVAVDDHGGVAIGGGGSDGDSGEILPRVADADVLAGDLLGRDRVGVDRDVRKRAGARPLIQADSVEVSADGIAGDFEPVHGTVGIVAADDEDRAGEAGQLIAGKGRRSRDSRDLDAVARALWPQGGQGVGGHGKVDLSGKPHGPVAVAGDELVVVDGQARGPGGPDGDAHAGAAGQIEPVAANRDGGRPVGKLDEERGGGAVDDFEAVAGLAEGESVGTAADVDSHGIDELNRRLISSRRAAQVQIGRVDDEVFDKRARRDFDRVAGGGLVDGVLNAVESVGPHGQAGYLVERPLEKGNRVARAETGRRHVVRNSPVGLLVDVGDRQHASRFERLAGETPAAGRLSPRSATWRQEPTNTLRNVPSHGCHAPWSEVAQWPSSRSDRPAGKNSSGPTDCPAYLEFQATQSPCVGMAQERRNSPGPARGQTRISAWAGPGQVDRASRTAASTPRPAPISDSPWLGGARNGPYHERGPHGSQA